MDAKDAQKDGCDGVSGFFEVNRQEYGGSYGKDGEERRLVSGSSVFGHWWR